MAHQRTFKNRFHAASTFSACGRGHWNSRNCVFILSREQKVIPQSVASLLHMVRYATAEVIFSAGTIHQLAMFLHFKGLGPRWACPYNSRTKSTERIIAELQGKTNELQSLDSQPTFGDMLDRSTKVPFNINAKHRLSTTGAKISSSHKRKRLAFAFRSSKGQESYEYPERYSEFKAAQIQAHRRGVNKAQLAFRSTCHSHALVF